MFSFSRSREGLVLVADVGDAGVGLATVALKSDAPAEIHFARRAMLPLEDRSREQAAAAIMKLIEEKLPPFLAEVEKEGAPAIHAIHVILRSPWTRFRSAKAEEIFPESQPVTKEIIASLAKKALTAPSELDRAAILEAGVLQVFLNGYPTGNPLGKRAKSVSVVAFESDVDTNMRTSVTGVLGKAVPGRTPIFHSGLRALLTVMHEHLPDIHRYALVDIGGLTSTCTVVRKESVTQHAVIPEGVASILKRISAGGLPEETFSLLRMLATDSCSTTACQGLKDSLARAEPELVRAFGEVLGKMAGERRLPNAMMLFAPAELTPWLQGFFSRIDFAQFTATTQPLEVETLSPEHLLDMVSWAPGIIPDAGITIGASCVNILEGNA